MTRRRLLILFVAACLVLASVVVLQVLSVDPVAPAWFDAISLGMTEQEVLAVVGSTPYYHDRRSALDLILIAKEGIQLDDKHDEETLTFETQSAGNKTAYRDAKSKKLLGYNMCWVGPSHGVSVHVEDNKVIGKLSWRVVRKSWIRNLLSL